MKKLASILLILCSLGLAPVLAGSGSSTATKAVTEWIVRVTCEEEDQVKITNHASAFQFSAFLSSGHSSVVIQLLRAHQDKRGEPFVKRQLYQRTFPEESFLS